MARRFLLGNILDGARRSMASRAIWVYPRCAPRVPRPAPRGWAGRYLIDPLSSPTTRRLPRGERAGGDMQKQVVHTPKVPPARVPLSQAIKVGEWVFASGQLGLDVKTGKLAEGGIAAETRQVCENLKAVLEAGGSSLEKVVKVTIYLADMKDLMKINNAFGQYSPKAPPARTTFQCVALVGGARVEIEAIAHV